MENLLKTSNSVDETRAIAKELAQSLKESRQNLFLIGDLGTGKTTFLKGFGEGLGIKEEDIISPTFQLVRRYKGSNDIKLIHVDLYRLNDINEILHLGWWDLLEEDGITAVEWADRAKEILPDEAVFLKIKLVSKDKRQIEIYNNKKDIPWN